MTKLWNIGKFILQFKDIKKPKKLEKIDNLFIEYIDYLECYCDEYYSKYDFHNPAVKLRAFLWEIFASHYLELIKSRAYNKDNKFSKEEQESAFYTLRYLFKKLLVLLYPIIPAITSELYKACDKNIFEENIRNFSDFKSFDNIFLIQQLMNLNSNIWKAKKEKGLSLNAPVKIIYIHENLLGFEKDLKICHNASQIKKGEFKVEFV